MSKLEKDIERLKLKPKDYTYGEVKSLLNKLGFYENNKGKTSGSRAEFNDNNGKERNDQTTNSIYIRVCAIF